MTAQNVNDNYIQHIQHASATNSVVTVEYFNGTGRAMEADGEANALHRIDYLRSMQIDRGVPTVYNEEGARGIRYKRNGAWNLPADRTFYRDHLGSIRVTDYSNTGFHRMEQESYYPFGTSLGESTALASSGLKYTGKELDRTNGLDLYDFGARMYDPILGRWDRMDPMCEKYYSVSPYAYCHNNPVNRVDPDGRDVWEVNDEGRIINRIADRTQDAFYMVAIDADGNYQRTFTTDTEGNKIYNSISFEYGTVESQRSISFSPDGKTVDTYDMYKVRGDNNGTALFEFMSTNISGSGTGIEIRQAMTGVTGDNGLNFITTGHMRATGSSCS